MFGYVQANPADLSLEEQARYKAAYCGLCRTLGKRHGFLSRLALTYDLTFLALLLSSLYEPEESTGQCRCCIHPCRKHPYAIDPYTEYAADMTIALTYHKCMDDWKDDRRLLRRCYAGLLKKPYRRVKADWPDQCACIETSLDRLSRLEQQGIEDPDAASRCFGQLMEGLFVCRNDHWAEPLGRLGRGLGEYIYLADAAVDLEEDRAHGRYNPLNSLSSSPQELRPTLMMVLGDASQAFETLPLLQDIHLLRNILYSGIWTKYNLGTQKKEKVNE